MASAWRAAYLAVVIVIVATSVDSIPMERKQRNDLTCPEVRDQALTECAGRLGCNIPSCKGDDFAATQCPHAGCHCVGTDGTPIGNYNFHIADYGDCQCARDEAAGVNLNEPCGTNGSY